MTECVQEGAEGYHLLSRSEHVLAIAAEWAHREYWAGWRLVRCPVLLLEAERSATPPGQMALMATQLPHAVHRRIPSTGHLLHADAPEAFRAAVTERGGSPLAG